MSPERRQRGATLLVVLVMLAMITLFVISMLRLSNANLTLVGNMQVQRQLEASAQQAIEQSISTIGFFTDVSTGVPGNSGAWPGGTDRVTTSVNNHAVTVDRPVCVSSQIAEGYSAASQVAPEDTHWEVSATAADSVTGASVNLSQGFKIRLAAGSCP